MARLLILMIVAIALAGCGYRQTNQYEKGPAVGQGAAAEVRTVAVPTFINVSGVAGVEDGVTQAVRDAIASSKVVRLTDMQKADSAIEGRVVEVKLRSPATRPSSPSDIQRIRIQYYWRNLWTESRILDTQVADVPDYSRAGLAVAASIGGDQKTAGKTDKYPWHSLYREDVRTVAVPIFTNRTYVRGLEMQLTKAIGNYMESATPYKIVPREKAETILEGEIVAVSGTTISTDRVSALPQEEMVTVTVNFVWKDLRNGQILTQRKEFKQTTMYYPTLGEGLYVGTQLNAERLAMAIVQSLQAEW